MKKRVLIVLVFCFVSSKFLMAQENPITPVLNLNLEVDKKCVGTGCGGALEEQAQTFSILKGERLPSGQIKEGSFFLEKHEWQKDENGHKIDVKLSDHPTEINKTESGTEYIIHYPTDKMLLTIHYTLGTFNPETKTQDLTISNIEGVASLKQKGNLTPDKISFQWKLVQKEDGSLKIIDAQDPTFEIDHVTFKIGAEWSWGGPYGGGTSFEVQGTHEETTEDGQKTRVPHVESKPISYRASLTSEDQLACNERVPSHPHQNIMDFIKNFDFLL